ncbi:MAG TPA: NAD(P)/FAD-dependent oxidoreductase [Alphaproteobacteria bacterium]|nr:NAD(P)/FAD-dependent oxidoreductase [Alphaproteobacteria bacterium]
MSSHPDIVVIGAGAAGIAAARKLDAAGASYVVLEAAARIGGRGLTDHSLGYPVDLGCTWLHSADENPLANAPKDSFGHDLDPSYLYLDDLARWASGQEQAAIAAYVRACERVITQAGERGEDPPVDTLVSGEPHFRRHFEWWCGAYTSVTPPEIGALDWARYRDTGENWTVPTGFGARIARRAGGLAIYRQTPVLSIEDAPGGRLSLVTPAGVLRPRTVILTGSPPALQRIRFRPALPDWKQAALERLPLGRANKVVVRFDGLDPEWCSARSAQISVRFGRYGRPIAEAFIEASLARALEPEGEAAQIAFVLDQYAAMYGNAVKTRVRGARASLWGATPWIWGAYSAMTPGGGDPRADLARPVDGRLFFAGEATHPYFFTAAHGAWLSGERAAEEAMEAISER